MTDLPRYETLYVSRLARHASYEDVHAIIATARPANRKLRIGGVLLFDGEHFGQLIDGAEADVVALMQRIATDPRHTEVTTLYSGVSGSSRGWSEWRSGYCDPPQLELLGQPSTPRGTAALAIFRSIALGADLA